jgi:hypothetical protein
MQLLSFFKKSLVLATAVFCVALVGITNSNAASDSAYLAQIAKNTSGMLTKLNNLPATLAGLDTVIKMAISWLQPDDSDATAAMQGNFAITGKMLGEANPNIAATNQQILAALFNVSAKSKRTFASVPDINTFTYPTFLGTPLASGGSSTATLSYIMNASGVTLPHQFPSDSWQGDPYSVVQYKNLYQVITSISTFNSAVLTDLYYRHGKDFTTAQEALITKAGSSDWIQEVSTEELGKVMRQLLLFTAQQYVLSSELIKLQKQALMASVMTNTLLILNNQKNEFDLLDKAKKAP